MTGHVGKVSSLSYTADGQWSASGSEDGIIIIWKKENGDHLTTLISLKSSDDWLVVTPEGFFDGSPLAWEQILWRLEKTLLISNPSKYF